MIEHEGHWECRLTLASEALYEACKAIECAFDQRRDIDAALRKVRAAIAVAESQLDPVRAVEGPRAEEHG